MNNAAAIIIIIEFIGFVVRKQCSYITPMGAVSNIE